MKRLAALALAAVASFAAQADTVTMTGGSTPGYFEGQLALSPNTTPRSITFTFVSAIGGTVSLTLNSASAALVEGSFIDDVDFMVNGKVVGSTSSTINVPRELQQPGQTRTVEFSTATDPLTVGLNGADYAGLTALNIGCQHYVSASGQAIRAPGGASVTAAQNTTASCSATVDMTAADGGTGSGNAVPEPGSLALIGAALTAAGLLRRRCA